MLQFFIIISILTGLALLLLGINTFVFGRGFPETELGKNRNMIRLGLRCPQCEERIRYRKPKLKRINTKKLQPDWPLIKS
jgi:hypothetical protein